MDKSERLQEIHDKGFDMSGFSEFKKVKVGLKTLEDATLDLGTFRN